MVTRRCTVLAILMSVLVLAGCKNDGGGDESALLTEENQTLRDELAQRNKALDAAYDENRDLSTRNSELRRQLDDLERTASATPVTVEQPPASTATPFDEIAGVTGDVRAGEVTATIESDVLFDSGKATLKSSAKRALNAVAQIISSSYGGHRVRIDGHTDADPIRKSGYKSNHHLGFERAFAVREYLVSRGVSTDRMYVASFGPNEPRGSKEQSRRVEIAVLLN